MLRPRFLPILKSGRSIVLGCEIAKLFACEKHILFTCLCEATYRKETLFYKKRECNHKTLTVHLGLEHLGISPFIIVLCVMKSKLTISTLFSSPFFPVMINSPQISKDMLNYIHTLFHTEMPRNAGNLGCIRLTLLWDKNMNVLKKLHLQEF